MAKPLQAVLPNPGEEEVVRICVLGASGVGKSSLCNFLCDSSVFKIGDGFDSCTQQPKTYAFIHDIDNKSVHYEITDTPGWFDADQERLPSVHTMLKKINECIKISETGITAFFICVPFERISIDTEQSIYFMRDCFDSTQLKHVWLIFTKCKKITNIQVILEQLLQQKNRGRKASGLVYNYTQIINEQCFATDTLIDDEKQLSQTRDNILKEMNLIYHEYGMIPDGVFQTAQRNYQSEIDRLSKKYHDDRIQNQYQYKRMMTLGTVIGVGFVAAGINGYMKYNSLMSDNHALQQENMGLMQTANELSQQTEVLSQQNQEMARINKQNSMFAGIAETAAGALWFAIEPVSGAVAIFDGLQRIYLGGSETPN